MEESSLFVLIRNVFGKEDFVTAKEQAFTFLLVSKCGTIYLFFFVLKY